MLYILLLVISSKWHPTPANVCPPVCFFTPILRPFHFKICWSLRNTLVYPFCFRDISNPNSFGYEKPSPSLSCDSDSFCIAIFSIESAFFAIDSRGQKIVQGPLPLLSNMFTRKSSQTKNPSFFVHHFFVFIILYFCFFGLVTYFCIRDKW